MNIKKISIITSSIVVIGGVIWGTAYKMHVESVAKQKIEANSIKENENTEGQTKTHQLDKENDENKNSNIVSKKTGNEDINNLGKVKKEKVIHSEFKFKLESYVAKFKKSGDDIYTLMQSLDSINTNNLNKNEKEKLDNLKLAAREWSSLNTMYDDVRQTKNSDNDPDLDRTLECAKEALKCNTQNLIDTGIMSKASVDKKVSLINEYIEKANKYKDNEKKKKDEEIAQINKIKKKTVKERKEYYYKKIKDAMDAEIKYINSIDDSQIRSSVQSSVGAAVAEATYLEMKFPEDTEIIQANLQKVLEVK